MSEDTSLRDFILGYCQQVGGLIEPPAYGIYEVLLPEDVAVRWGVDSFQRFTFTPEAGAEKGATTLYYGHPLVETIVFELRQRPANTLFFINPPRLEKPGLRELVEKTFTFPNARPAAGHTQRTRLYHYVCFNIKASLVSDEKRELLIQLWMHLQGGYRVPGSEIQTRVVLETENASPHLDAAPPGWRALQPKENPLSSETLTALLERVRLAVLDEIAPTLETAQKRSRHFLDLDRARLTDYYAGLRRDLEKRLSKVEDGRRPVLVAKLAALQTERQSKLADAEQKYHMRLDLELINLAIIAQPKIELDVEISKRGVTAQRRAAWDPVRHILEPLVCGVCGQPGEGLHLCESGHLAHTDCLAPQCSDCKRTFCRLCAEKVHTCVVCDAPVCVHSLTCCKTCGRETCQKHPNLCHAADGQPQRTVVAAQTPAQAEPQSPSKAEPPKPAAAKPPKMSVQTGGKAKAPQPKKPFKPASLLETATAQRIQVEVETGRAEVRAFALHKEREIAVRVWELAVDGIGVSCRCEKGWNCRADGVSYRPAEAGQIEAQLMSLIRAFAAEYSVPEKKISFLRMIGGRVFEEHRLNLASAWKDPETLAAAQAGFNKLPRR